MADRDPLIARGYEPYNGEAGNLRGLYSEKAFADKHAHFRPFFPGPAGRVLDVGAGVGVDAKGFADLGCQVVAVEPAREMRAIAMADHDHANITWVDDCLPYLSEVSVGDGFDFILSSASFMHLPPALQPVAVSRLAALLRNGGALGLSVRHGPVPEGRTMYEITPDEMKAFAEAAGLSCAFHNEVGDFRNRQGVSWSLLVFCKPQSGSGSAP